ncbi:hypothetical protein Lal_00039415 [Lupinus albus]|nr:hypothetical protein Lal_00039415 [Lupinus albus]
MEVLVDKGIKDGLYISCVAASENMWALIMDGGTVEQIYMSGINDVWVLIFQFKIRIGLWSNGRKTTIYISPITGADYGSFLVIMSKGTPYTKKLYNVSESFPFKWINNK